MPPPSWPCVWPIQTGATTAQTAVMTQRNHLAMTGEVILQGGGLRRHRNAGYAVGIMMRSTVHI